MGTIPPGPQGAVNAGLQPAAHRLLGEGVDDQHHDGGGQVALRLVPDRHQADEEGKRQLVQLQGQGDEAGVDEGGADDEADIEQVVDKHGVRDGEQEEDRGEGADVDEAEVAEDKRQQGVGRQGDGGGRQSADPGQAQLAPGFRVAPALGRKADRNVAASRATRCSAYSANSGP